MNHGIAVAQFTTHLGPRQKELDVSHHKSSEECIPQFPSIHIGKCHKKYSSLERQSGKGGKL